MESSNRLRLRTWQIILPVLALTLIFGVACGSAAAPAEESLPAAGTAPQQPPAQPAAEAAPTAVPPGCGPARGGRDGPGPPRQRHLHGRRLG